MRVLKWSVKTDGHTYYIGGGRPVYLNSQRTADEIQVWTLEPDEPSLATRRARVVGTGQVWSSDRWTYLGSVVPRTDLVGQVNLDTVWHVIGET